LYISRSVTSFRKECDLAAFSIEADRRKGADFTGCVNEYAKVDCRKSPDKTLGEGICKKIKPASKKRLYILSKPRAESRYKQKEQRDEGYRAYASAGHEFKVSAANGKIKIGFVHFPM